jgi:hypothetical protein
MKVAITSTGPKLDDPKTRIHRLLTEKLTFWYVPKPVLLERLLKLSRSRKLI